MIVSHSPARRKIVGKTKQSPAGLLQQLRPAIFATCFDLATLVQIAISLYGFVLLTVLFLTIYHTSLMDEKKLLFHVHEVAWL